MEDAQSEVGRELRPDELKPEQIVVIAPPGRDELITMWVMIVDDKRVVFYSAIFGWSVINFIRDGKLYDNRNREVQIYEYLGEP